MLLMVIAAAAVMWLTIIAVVVGACASAAHGDRELRPAQPPTKRPRLRLLA
jgi:hypothetical protein